MTIFHEYPKWLHADGRDSVLVLDAEAEAAQLAAWAPNDANAAPIVPAIPETPPAVSIPAATDEALVPAGPSEPAESLNALTQPQKRPGGWPKGKSRNVRRG